MAYLLAHDVDRPEMPRSGDPSANTTLRLVGAAPLPVEVDDVIRSRFGVETFSGAYGVTEASLISWQPPGVENKPNAAGVINDEYFDVRIFDDDDNEVPVETPGEIVGRPRKPNVMFDGYWGAPKPRWRCRKTGPHWRHRPFRRRRFLYSGPQSRLHAPPGKRPSSSSSGC
jgi:crotonobetaine/carnitine-CoA ligase